MERVLEKPVVADRVKKFCAFYGNGKFITLFTKAPPPVPVLRTSKLVHVLNGNLREMKNMQVILVSFRGMLQCSFCCSGVCWCLLCVILFILRRVRKKDTFHQNCIIYENEGRSL
jgi:hypothetical protein